MLSNDEVNRLEARIRAHYENANYSEDTRAFEERVFAKLRRYLFQFAPPNGLILEVAMADGKNLPYYPPGSIVHAIDLSAAQLAKAKANAVGLDLTLETHVGSVHAMPFEKADFDAVVCTLGLCTIPNPEQAIREMSRVARPNARLLFMEHVYPRDSALMRFFCRCIQGIAAKKMPGCETTRDTIGAIEAAGLKIVERRRRFGGLLETFVAEHA